jgi:hypothetical protein
MIQMDGDEISALDLSIYVHDDDGNQNISVDIAKNAFEKLFKEIDIQGDEDDYYHTTATINGIECEGSMMCDEDSMSLYLSYYD